MQSTSVPLSERPVTPPSGLVSPLFSTSPQWRDEESRWPDLDPERQQQSNDAEQTVAHARRRRHSNSIDNYGNSEDSPCLKARSDIEDHHVAQPPSPHGDDIASGKLITTVTEKSSRSSSDKTISEHAARSSGNGSSSNIYTLINDWWLVELASLALGLVCFAAIAITLSQYNGLSVHAWQHRITLNTIISLLAVVGGACLAGPVSASIGQTKWIWFKGRTRPLAHYQALDGASRGAIGCGLLLLHGRGGIVTALGALLPILLLAVNPFVQQVVSLVPQRVEFGSATLPIAVGYAGYEKSTTLLYSSMQAAVYNGILSTTDASFAIVPSCTTGNCTWETNYSTLAVCSTCQDITNLITPRIILNNTAMKARDYTLPNGFNLTQNGGQVVMHWSYTYFNLTTSAKPLVLGEYGSRLADIQVISSPDEGIVQAHECALQLCVKTYKANDADGHFTEVEQTSWINDSNIFRPSDCTGEEISGSASCKAKWWFSPPNQASVFTVDLLTITRLMTFLNTTFVGTHTAKTTNPGNNVVPVSILEQRFYNILSNQTSTLTFPVMLDYVAQSMSVNLRSTAGGNSTGVSTTLTTVYHVSWGWLAFPFALVALAFAFLMFVAVSTRLRGLRPWKNNSIAAFAHGLDEQSKGLLLAAGNGQHEVEKAADELDVRLEDLGGGWVLAGHHRGT